jgi:hypothetical protein
MPGTHVVHAQVQYLPALCIRTRLGRIQLLGDWLVLRSHWPPHQLCERREEPGMAPALPYRFPAVSVSPSAQTRAAYREKRVGKKGHGEVSKAMRGRYDGRADRRSRGRGSVQGECRV